MVFRILASKWDSKYPLWLQEPYLELHWLVMLGLLLSYLSIIVEGKVIWDQNKGIPGTASAGTLDKVPIPADTEQILCF